jgi:hypothetical protein
MGRVAYTVNPGNIYEVGKDWPAQPFEPSAAYGRTISVAKGRRIERQPKARPYFQLDNRLYYTFFRYMGTL